VEEEKEERSVGLSVEKFTFAPRSMACKEAKRVALNIHPANLWPVRKSVRRGLNLPPAFFSTFFTGFVSPTTTMAFGE